MEIVITTEFDHKSIDDNCVKGVENEVICHLDVSGAYFDKS